MIIDLEDCVESDILSVSKDSDNNYLIIKRNDDDFILASTSTYVYSEIKRMQTIDELEILGIFPRKGEELYSWDDYKQIINNRKNEEIIKPF